MMKETEYPGYFVTDTGKIFSKRQGKLRELKLTVSPGGYKRFKIWRNGKNKSIEVHWMVAKAFLGPYPPGYEVNHKQGKLDNHVSNLEYVTHRQNVQHAYDTGLTTKLKVGERHYRAKLTDKDCLEICRRFNAGESYRVLSEEYGVPSETIRRIIGGRSRSYLQVNKERFEPPRKLAVEQVVEMIKGIIAKRIKRCEAAALYGISRPTVTAIMQRRIWEKAWEIVLLEGKR